MATRCQCQPAPPHPPRLLARRPSLPRRQSSHQVPPAALGQAQRQTGQRCRACRVELEHRRDVLVARELGVRAVLVTDAEEDVLPRRPGVERKRKLCVDAPRVPAAAVALGRERYQVLLDGVKDVCLWHVHLVRTAAARANHDAHARLLHRSAGAWRKLHAARGRGCGGKTADARVFYALLVRGHTLSPDLATLVAGHG